MGSDVAEIETARIRSRSRRTPIGGLSRSGARKPVLVLAGGIALVALGAGLIDAHVTAWSLDETVIEQSAVHYTSGLPHTFFYDVNARATSRLYPLVLSLAFHFVNGAQAIRADHVLSAVLFTSTAIPVYLLARVLLRSPWYAVAAALLSVAVPWLTISSALFEENLAYPMFWWTVLACCYAAWKPRLRNDALALLAIALLIGTRVEFASVFLGYVIALAAVSVWRAQGGRGPLHRLGGAVVGAVRGHPLSAIAAVAAAGFVIYARFLSSYLEHELGTYANVVYRSSLPPNMAEAILVQLIALGLGVGLLPAIVSLPWYVRRMASLGKQLERSDVYLLCAGVLLAVFLIGTAFAQDGYLGPGTEERYFFYVIPAFWLGTFAALEDRRLSAGDVVLSAVALAALFGAIPFVKPLDGQAVFLAPVEETVPHVMALHLPQLGLNGLTVSDALVLITLLAGAATAFVWRRRRRWRTAWTVGVAAALQLVIAGYAFAIVDGRVTGIVGRTIGTVAPLGWVDSHARSANVTWLDNGPIEAVPGGVPLSVDRQRTALFWNSHLRSWASLPALGLPPPEWPMTALDHSEGLTVEPTTGLIAPAASAAGIDEVVSAMDSPYLQLAGVMRGESEHVLALERPSRPLRAIWTETGLQNEGYVLAGQPVHLYAFAPSATGGGAVVALTFAPAPSVPTASLVVHLGASSHPVTLKDAGPAVRVSLPVCFAHGQRRASGSIQLTGAKSPVTGTAVAKLQAVTVEPAATSGCPAA